MWHLMVPYYKMKIPPFNPSDLRPIRILYKEGKFPPETSVRYIRELCQKKKFPSIKIGQEWNTTETAIRAYFWAHANKAFKDITS
jgi:hypothetical protein